MPSRIEMPEEFYDLTTAQMLRQPEPQYLFAGILSDAINATLDVPGTIGLMPGREAPSNGQPAYRMSDADRLSLVAEKLPAKDMIAFAHDFKAGPGHTIRINRPRYANTTYTQAARKVLSGATISTTPITIGGEQNTLTLYRFGGPYDGDNSRVAPFALEAFDAQLGVHHQAAIIGQHLKRDFDRFIDSVLVALLDTAGLGTKVYPTAAITADNDMVTATPLVYEQVSRAAKVADIANLPVLPNGKRVLVVDPTGKKQLKDDPQYARYAEFHKEMNALFPSYFGTLPEFECFTSNSITSVDNSSNLAVFRGKVIAPGALMVGMGRPPSVRVNSNDNYAETFLCIWLADLGFEIADSRFVLDVRYTEDA